MLQLQMFQETYFDFSAYELIHMFGLKGDSEVSKRLLWQQNLGVVVVFKNILRTIAIEIGHRFITFLSQESLVWTWMRLMSLAVLWCFGTILLVLLCQCRDLDHCLVCFIQ